MLVLTNRKGEGDVNALQTYILLENKETYRV